MTRAVRVRAASLVLLLGCASCHRAALSEGARAAPTTARPLAAQPAPLAPGALRFAVIGDFGTGGPDELAVARLVTSWTPSFIITTGDNNHPDGLASELESHVAAAYAQYIPGNHGAFGAGGPQRFFPTLGNHDWRSPDGLQAYLDFFRVPGRYYDQLLADGRVELFALDSDPHEPDGNTADSKQARWLRERAAASRACLRLVAFHHPPYSSSLHGSTAGMQWPFRAMGISAVLSGHDHVYERLEIDGIPYFVDGLGGAQLYPFRTPLPQSQVRYDALHGAMLITLSPDEVRYEAWNVDGERIDSLAIPINCPAPGPAAPGAAPGAPAASPSPAR